MPAIAIGAFAINYYTGNSFFVVSCITLGNTLEAFVGFYILNLFLRPSVNHRFSPHTKTVAVLTASVFGALISATTGSLILTLNHLSSWRSFSTLWFTWWTGDMLGGLIIIPLALAFFKNPFEPFPVKKINIKSIFAVTFAGLILCFFLFIRPGGAPFLFFI